MNEFDFDLPSRATWVFTGDSITQGAYHTHGFRSWVELVSERVRWELGRTQDIVINSGVSAWTAQEINTDFEYLIGRFAPQVLSVSLGTNDALDGEAGLNKFRRRLTEIVRRGTKIHSTVVLHTPVLVLRDAPPARHEWLPAYAEVIRTIANDEGAILVDHEQHWRQHFAAEAPTAWMDDNTHPNAVGHRHIADTTLRTLRLGPLQEQI